MVSLVAPRQSDGAARDFQIGSPRTTETRQYAWVSDPAEEAESALMMLADEAKQGASGTFIATMKAIILLMEGVQADLPAVGAAALAEARRVWFGSGDPARLVDARVECWNYLQSKNESSTVIRDREDQALRGVICCLYPEDEIGDVFMAAEVVHDMLRLLGVQEAAIASAVDMARST